MANILIIEDEAALAKNIARYFQAKGHQVDVAGTGREGVALAARTDPDVVIVDFQLPGMDGVEVIRTIRTSDPDVRLIMVTGHASVNVAVDAMKAGSMDLLTKPVALSTLDAVVERALVERSARKALAYYQRREADHSTLDAMVGHSPAMQALKSLLRTIASSEPQDGSVPPPVLIQGETGVGKELVARACHYAGARAAGPFVEVNCAALPAALIEGELFGHEKGAFTDAQARKLGLIEAADGGTLFLDEIGEMDLGLQAKLLRVLENMRVRRLGAVAERQVNVRVVAATNRPLDAMVQAQRFRGDLLYRLQVFHVQVPPLRDRGDDVLELAEQFAAQCAARYGKVVAGLDRSACDVLRAHLWPGNVRELRNVMERAILLLQGNTVSAADLHWLNAMAASPAQTAHSPNINESTNATPLNPAASRPLEAAERDLLLRALQQAHWNVTRAARLLNITRDTLRYRMERHGLQRPLGGLSMD